MTPAQIDKLTVPTGKRQRVKIARNLFLIVKPNGARSWLYRHTQFGVRTDHGLGAYPAVPFKVVKAIIDAPDVERAIDRHKETLSTGLAFTIPTFEQHMHTVVALRERKWKPGTELRQSKDWLSSLARHAAPLMHMKVSDITKNDVARVIGNCPTAVVAKQTRERIAIVLEHAAIADLRPDDRPASVRAMEVLASYSAPKSHQQQAACPVDAVADVYAALPTGCKGDLIRFMMLTVVRAGEATGAQWCEIDMDAALWTVPGERMKTGKAHTVPLAPAAVALLKAQGPATDGLVFPGCVRGRPWHRNMPNRVINTLCKRLGITDCKTGATPTAHGVRSTFRDWTDECTSADFRAKEMALAHAVGSQVERAYARSDLLDKRRALMEEWADHLTGSASAA